MEYANDLYEVKKEEREIDLHDMNRSRIGRTGFSKLCDYPGFEEAVIGIILFTLLNRCHKVNKVVWRLTKRIFDRLFCESVTTRPRNG